MVWKLPVTPFGLAILPLVGAFAAATASDEFERFSPRDGEAIELWRITNDPTARDHANYHNMQCWSPDGRYLCYTHYGPNDREYGARSAAEVHLYDLHQKSDTVVSQGTDPRWANKHNWLFFLNSSQVAWHDVERGSLTPLAGEMEGLKETDHNDQWLYGFVDGEDRRLAARIRLEAGASSEVLPGDWGVGYNSLYVNPQHPLIVSRDHNYPDYLYATPGTRDIPFTARHFFDHDLAGEQRTTPFPLMEGSHFSWNGDGSYFLDGNGQVRGRKWDEPLPSNIHFLANNSVGDTCPCGFSGRWICGSTGGGRGPLQLADTRSGDGSVLTKTYSFLCFPGEDDNSGPYDIDAKGSPDGTKIAFISTYDLKDGPATEMTQDFYGDRLVVASTEGFPENGGLVIASGFGGEVMGYSHKTRTSFEGLTRGLYRTIPRSESLKRGQPVTSFDAALIPEKQRRPGLLPSRSLRAIVKEMDSPLMWQRQSDLYVAVARRPDAPHLRQSENDIQLIPGENHWETYGYHLFREGTKITTSPLQAGSTLDVSEAGSYTVVAVEWSGLESQPSLPLKVEGAATVTALREKPADFSWANDRWLVGGQEATERQARCADEAIRETVHLHDGVIHRQWLQRGKVVRQHDLNSQGKPIRQLFYDDGRLVRREYHDRNGKPVSTELIDTDEFITDSIQYDDDGEESTHWWYERAVPVKYQRGSRLYVKEGDGWTQRQSAAERR